MANKDKTVTKKKVTKKKTVTKRAKKTVPKKRKASRKKPALPNIIINEGGQEQPYPPPPYPYYYPQPPPYGYPPPDQEIRAEQAGSVTAPVDNKVQGDTNKPDDDDDTKPKDDDKKDDDKKDDDKKKKDPHKWRNRFLIALVFILIGVVIAGATGSGAEGGLFGVTAETPCNQRGGNETMCLNGINCTYFKDTCVDIDPCSKFSTDRGFCNNNTSDRCMYLEGKCKPKVCSDFTSYDDTDKNESKEKLCNDVPTCYWQEGQCFQEVDVLLFIEKVSLAFIGISALLLLIFGFFDYRASNARKAKPGTSSAAEAEVVGTRGRKPPPPFLAELTGGAGGLGGGPRSGGRGGGGAAAPVKPGIGSAAGLQAARAGLRPTGKIPIPDDMF